MSDDLPRDDARDGDAPSATGASPVSAVGALMEERRRYESWLAALEARRSETPKHVFTRVHADYTARLESVVQRLVSHTDGLRAELTVLTTRIASLDEQRHRARDERAEAELRAHVGELTDNAWKEVAAASDALIASLAAQHAAAEEDLRRTRELLVDAERPPTPVPAPAPVSAESRAPGATAETKAATAPAPVEPAPVSDSAEVAAHVPGAEPSGDSAAPADGAQKPGEGSFDELAFLQSVVDVSNGSDSKSPPAKPTPFRPTGSAPAASPPPSSPAGPPRREPFVARKPEPRPEDRIQKQGEGSAPLIQAKQGNRGSLAANISGNNPIVLKDKPSESAKTLKCAECGAMNYPTEWYCERCGAELASL